ncbi:hypothetical protein [Aromatoleum diolicum]|uniref:Uncharacterized protein n=1 Tax=Aromatoleum diolicum TaxID=75796 RepID=A0ABX1Q813_9RHOO|nr:hypothetical protein [Aromatoleum diolicum]NMG73270.1 hypothetical protein [Aromatoleum diolicum]
MDAIRQILENFRGTLPDGSTTAAAIDRGAAPEEISACATEEGLHALAGALFEACEENLDAGGEPAPQRTVIDAVAARLQEFRQQLPATSETARMIDRGASLEEISEAAQQEGLSSLASLLFEAEREAGGRS